MRKLIVFCLVVLPFLSQAQDINARVQVVSPKITMTNKQRFKTLELAIIEFLNNRKWTTDKINTNERIDCTFFIDVTGFDGNDGYEADITIQSSRPVYGSSYSTVMMNQIDEKVMFKYVELQALEYQDNANLQQLTSVLAFYTYIILGLDYDSFSLMGGTPYFVKAQNIANMNSGQAGWNSNDGKSNKNRYYLIENLTNDRFKPLRETYYRYHMQGLDIMYKDVAQGRKAVIESLQNVQKVYKLLPNAMLLKVFFNAKADELVKMFKESPRTERTKMAEMLNLIDPANTKKYNLLLEG